MSDPIAAYLARDIPAPVAFARLALSGVPRADGLPPGDALRVLIETRSDAAASLRRLAVEAGLDHAAADTAAVAAAFDKAAGIAPDLAMAAYALGDTDMITRATGEVVDWLRAEGLLAGDVLDLGCGTGRIAEAMAPYARSVTGIDLSSRMIALARARSGHGNVRYLETDGRTWTVQGAFDLILAADSLPYAVLAGIADETVARAMRRLRPGGAMAILNLSYRGDKEADAADARRWAAAHGASLRIARPFRLWDATAFTLGPRANRMGERTPG